MREFNEARSYRDTSCLPAATTTVNKAIAVAIMSALEGNELTLITCRGGHNCSSRTSTDTGPINGSHIVEPSNSGRIGTPVTEISNPETASAPVETLPSPHSTSVVRRPTLSNTQLKFSEVRLGIIEIWIAQRQLATVSLAYANRLAHAIQHWSRSAACFLRL